jgi:hypothetical protein
MDPETGAKRYGGLDMSEALKWIGIGVVALFALSILGFVLGLFNEGTQVAQEEFGPRAAIDKYNNLKSIRSSLEGKIYDMQTQANSIKALEALNNGTPRNQWARSDLETYNIRTTDLNSIVMSYNSLASEYNWKMASINWAFADVGQLPKGADGVLPREYSKYVFIDSTGEIRNTGISESVFAPKPGTIWA